MPVTNGNQTVNVADKDNRQNVPIVDDWLKQDYGQDVIPEYDPSYPVDRDKYDNSVSGIAKDVGNNALATAKLLATEGLRPSAIVQAFLDTAEKGKKLMSGETPLYDRYGKPSTKAIEDTFDVASAVSGGASVVPAERNALRMGAGIASTPEFKRMAEVRGGFYSKAEEELLKSPQKSGTAEQYVAFLRGKGVKPYEIETLGFDKLSGKTTKEALVEHIKAHEPRFVETPTGFFSGSTYNVPGGTNYRMLNLRLDNPTSKTPFQYDVHELPDNTLVHARLKDDFVGGQKVLRVEELQSDWAQHGRENGFSDGSPVVSPEDLEVKRVPVEQLGEYVDAGLAQQLQKSFPGQTMTINRVRPEAMDRLDPGEYDRDAGLVDTDWHVHGAEDITSEQALELGREYYRNTDVGDTPAGYLAWRENQGSPGMPKAPYVTEGSSGIVPLMTKRLLLEAAQNGQKKIIFMPGDIHAERYAAAGEKTQNGLRKYYNEIIPAEVNKVLREAGKEVGEKDWKGKWEQTPVIPAKGDTIRDYAERVLSTQWRKENEGINRFQAASYLERFADDRNILPTQVDPEDLQTYASSLHQQIYVAKSRFALAHNKVEMLENMPHDQVMAMEANRSNESFMLQYDKALTAASESLDQIKTLEYQYKTVKASHRLLNDWKKHVETYGTAPKAFVIELPDNIAQHLLKNGLSRFAKGGIVNAAWRLV